MLSRLAFNITMRMIAGKQEANLDKFHKLIQEVLQLGISPNIGDFFPSLQWVEYFRGCKMKLTKLATEIDAFLQGVIDEYRRNKDIFERNKNYTMISQLLSLQESQPQYYTDDIIKGLLQDMILGATNAPVTTMEWTMSHLLNNLNALEKIKAELDFHVGHDKLLNEADLPKLHYLQNVIFESLRLSPPVPLLVPHLSSDKCKIGGYEIPEDTILLVNVWAIHRDPKLWAEATSFKLERFENGKKIEGYYKMLPFGLGRRSCPGMDLGHRIVGLALGSLIQCFEWKRVGLEKIDMSEGKSLNLLKAEPLEALLRARKIAKKLL
ncbi:Cytochrome P450 [Corchorus olitorius]|uniref:Cytochrome P450 n=1 Tax=Corchorus olitorius TaxID=93759 RepID=A0A1R3I1M8_9ROSI|nr:Cytochrome P450 [Corchorus olitorius]